VTLKKRQVRERGRKRKEQQRKHLSFLKIEELINKYRGMTEYKSDHFVIIE
jgi:hypothetical protein